MIDVKKLTKIEKIIYDNYHEGMQQIPVPRDTLLLNIFRQLKNGTSIAIEKNNTVFIIRKENQYVAQFDIFSDNKGYNFFKSGKEILKYVFETSDLRFIYNHTPNKKFVDTATQKGAFKYLGKMEKTYWDGEKFIDEYLFGTDKDYFMKQIEDM